MIPVPRDPHSHLDQPVRRVMVVLGTRPEAIKMAPVVRALVDAPGLTPVVVSTGQHRQMLDQMFEGMGFAPDVELNVMRDRQSLSGLTARLVDGLGDVVRDQRPDAVLVQGDTTTAFAGALAAFYERVPVGHVEAGLRSGRLDNPFPEELNRRLVAQATTWHFAPTPRAAQNLLAEGTDPACVEVTGNTVIDNLLWVRSRGLGTSVFPETARRKVLVTLHRRENQGAAMTALGGALVGLADRGDVELVLPLHMSPAVRDSLVPVLSGHPRIRVVEPLDYLDFTATLADAYVVLSDSGGVQEEAPTLGVPVLVLRETTERPEAIEAGTARLVGTDAHVVAAEAALLLDDRAAHSAMARATNPFGDGHAAQRIVGRLTSALAPAAARHPLLAAAGR